MSRSSPTLTMYQVLVVSCVVASVLGHGRVRDPPSRATAHRYGFKTGKNWDDNGTNCGGREHQWEVNGGKCGVCGDPYDAPTPRPHELNGVYGQGVIVRNYTGSLIDITVEITTNHQGYWEFKICLDPKRNDQECFDDYPLQRVNGDTKYYPKRGNANYTVTYRLPHGLVCDHCVLQWRYTSENQWGICSETKRGLECGKPEQFGACSDISIQKPVFKSVEDENAIRDDNHKKFKPYPWIKNRYFNSQQGKNQRF